MTDLHKLQVSTMRERTKADVLQSDFLEIRQRILDLAAMLDRYDLALESPTQAADPRLAQIREAIALLLETDRPRAEAVQKIFSLGYDPHWQEEFQLKPRF